MKKSRKPRPQPAAAETFEERVEVAKKANSASAVFINMVLDMTWRLAIVVLIPLIAGYQIDKHMHTKPLFTIVGFGLALAGTVLVIRQMQTAIDKLPAPKTQNPPKHRKSA
ncbi:MAG TPA: AtpZ/AtpI family protein [Candidatus Saccharimonadales bacterium]|nr:AtpZ/AtpI family protein [Candidatus Saccharimonadales bacterium]